ncbi:hypothetical protein RB628_34960 [Streptomyces sp. ADMS]|uniref:hypothetical protein n=1 Tax=Streptomyces sp. ADMS TaxID=3071415 RepID=UPI00296E7E52|nr:hypothetical protein [Streptomyces sp. ADMS]MDW4910393.1 hypothetical protein [Streptomyces sp. ADMS]
MQSWGTEHTNPVLLRGWVKVVAQSYAGYRALLALRGPGELLGEQAGLAVGPATAPGRVRSRPS